MSQSIRVSLLSIAAVALAAFLFAPATRAADDDQKAKAPITGVLIDQMCGEKQMAKDDPQAAAAKHPKSCAMKEGCAESGYAVISGKKMYKFDDKGNQLAKDYLAKSDSKMMVTVDGEVKDDGTMAVTDIKPAPAKG